MRPQVLNKFRALKSFLTNSIFLAAVIALLVVVWIVSGIGGEADRGDEITIAEKNGDPLDHHKMLVRVQRVESDDLLQNIRITGRSAAKRQAALAAETFGAVTALPVERGQAVKRGQTLIRLAVNEKRARVVEAEKALTKAEIEYKAAQRLLGDGFSTEFRAATTAAQVESARANLERARLDLANTQIKAPFDGILQERYVELGDYMREGDPAATILQLDPLRVIGFATENQRSYIAVGGKGQAVFPDGQAVEGEVTYLSSQAGQDTRTFRVELSVPNPDIKLVEGLTTQMIIKGGQRRAHFIASSWLVLNDAGEVGVRAAEKLPEHDDETLALVRFYPLTILEGDGNGLWVDGLPSVIDIITVGQAFVTEGQKIRIDSDTAIEAEQEQATDDIGDSTNKENSENSETRNAANDD